MKKRFFAIVLCMAMIVTMLPFNAFAEEEAEAQGTTDISMQNVQTVDEEEEEEENLVTEAETPQEAVDASSLLLAANTETAVAGSIACVNWDDNENEKYSVVTESSLPVSIGCGSNYLFLGKMESGEFCPAPGALESYSITVDKNGWSEAVSKENPTWDDPLRAGGFEGSYDCDEEALYLGFNENAIFLGEEAYGTYKVRVDWTIDNTAYYAEIAFTLDKAESLVGGYFYIDEGNSENDFLKSFSECEYVEKKDNVYTLKYVPYKDYAGYADHGESGHVMVLSDGTNGIYNYVTSNCDVEGLFSAGESVEYKQDFNITPLVVDYTKVTDEVIDKTYILTFEDSDGNKITRKICFEKDSEVASFEDGKLYATNCADTNVRDGIVYVENEVLDSVDLQIKDEYAAFYFIVWNEKIQKFKLADISADENLNISVTKNEDGFYNLYSSVSTSGTLKTDSGKTIEYNVSLPSCGFYSGTEKSDENYLADEIYLSKTGRDIYFIVDGNNVSRDELTLELKYSEIFNISNMPDGTDSNDNKYYVWKFTVKEDSGIEDGWENLEITVKKNGSNYYRNWIMIYGESAVTEENQMYWVYDKGIYVEDGILKPQEEDQYICADDRVRAENDELTGYFAIKTGEEEYCAIDNVALNSTSTEGFSVTKGKDDYLYTLKWTEESTQMFKATVDGKEYRIKISFELPDMGFYSTDERSVGSWLRDEFHYINAADESEEGASFYVIADAYADEYEYEYNIDEVKMATGRRVNGEWKTNENTEGITFGKLEKRQFGSENYFVCKVTVSEGYRSGEYDESFALVGDNDACVWDSELRIYDSTEIPKEQQMYWFNRGRVVISDEGELSISENEEYSFEDAADTNWEDSPLNGDKYGYFAVKGDDGNYYALKNVTVSDNKNVRLSLNKFEYCVEWNGFGEYIFEGRRGSKTYRFKLTVELPSMGFYSHAERTSENYLEEFYFADAAEKNNEGTASYFYVIADTYGYEADDVELNTGENSGTQGISIRKLEPFTLESGEYCVWQVTVTDEYEEKYSDSGNVEFIEKCDGDDYNSMSIYIHDAQAIPLSQQLYYFSEWRVDVENGKLVLEEKYSDCNLSSYAYKRLQSVCQSEDDVYFAILKNGEYYKIDISDAEGIRYSVDKASGYTILTAETAGEYKLTARDEDGKLYYFKGTVELPETGFWSKNHRSDETLLKEFNYNTADDSKHFYYIAPANYFTKDDEEGQIAEINSITVKVVKDDTCDEVSGITIAKGKEIVENEQTYYCWEVKVDESFVENDGEYIYIRCDYTSGMHTSGSFFVRGYKDYGNSVTVSGTITSTDRVDNTEVRLYCDSDETTEAYIKNNIVNSGNYPGCPVTEKGSVAGADGIYSQTYKFVDVGEGDYKLAVYKPGYGVHIENITLNGSTVTSDIKLSLLGDANGDGKVRIGDKAVLARFIAGWTGYENLLNKDAADINGDGDINNADLMILSRHLAGWLGYTQLEYGKQQIKTE